MAKKSVDEMSFLDHLEDLRWHLIRSTVAILIAAIIAYIFKEFIIIDSNHIKLIKVNIKFSTRGQKPY